MTSDRAVGGDDLPQGRDGSREAGSGLPAAEREAEGPGREDRVLERLLAELPNAPDPDLALTNLRRLLASAGGADLEGLLESAPGLGGTLLLVLGSSQFLADILCRNADHLRLLAEPEWLARPKSRDEMVDGMRIASRGASSSLDMMNCLRREKQREVLRIAAADLSGALGFEPLVEQISLLAEACLEVALERAMEGVGATSRGEFCVLGLGKLGGNELNYSSDVDVLFVYESSASAPAEWSETCARVARRVVEILGRVTDEGRLFRVDARLRPQGESGPLARSLDSYLAYYEAYGQPWERQALLKCRCVAGDVELGAGFVEGVAPFVYAKRLDEESKSHLRAMKGRYERRLMENGALESDVKQGHGGIRDIEFTVQVLQLICGANDVSLRKQGTLPALRALEEGGQLTEKEAETLSEAYVFLRTLEHRLQLMFELPMTRVPPDVADLLKVARRTVPQYKMTSVGAFRSLYDRLTDEVREIYERVLEVEVAPASPASPLGPWSLPEAQQDAGALRQKVAQYGFQNVGAALRVIEMMSRGPGLASQPAELVGPLLPQILEACYVSGDPDQALGNFERFSFLCGPKDIFYLTLRDNPSLIRTLGVLGGRSQFLSDVLTHNPQFLDILLDRGFLRRPSEKGELLSELSERLGKAESLEASLNLLRRYKQRELLRIGIRDLEGIADWQGVGQEISDLAEVCVETALRLTLAHAYEGQEPPRLAVFGLGKLGGRELHYASDLDLLLLSEGWGGVAEQQRQERVAEEIIGALSRVTEEGAAFKVDLRLRPEGKAGALIRSLEGYADYFEGRLETWQRQALIRARPVAGDAGLASQFSALLEKAVFGADFGAAAMEEIVAMRERIQRQRQSRVGGSPLDIKNGRGGIVELEFLVQLLQLAYGGSHSSLRTPYTARAIEALAAAGVVSDEQAGSLLGALGFLKKLENQLQMAKQRPSSALPASSTRQTVLAHQLGYSDQAPLPARELFLRDLQHATNTVREMWDSAVSSLRHRFESRGNER